MSFPLSREFVFCLSAFIEACKLKDRSEFSLRSPAQAYILNKQQKLKLNLCFIVCFDIYHMTLLACSSHQTTYVSSSDLLNDMFRRNSKVNITLMKNVNTC